MGDIRYRQYSGSRGLGGGRSRGLFGLPGYAICVPLVTHICCVLSGARCTLGVLSVFG